MSAGSKVTFYQLYVEAAVGTIPEVEGEQSRAEQSREQSGKDQSRAERNRTEQNRTEQRTEQSRADQSRAGHHFETTKQKKSPPSIWCHRRVPFNAPRMFDRQMDSRWIPLKP